MKKSISTLLLLMFTTIAPAVTTYNEVPVDFTEMEQFLEINSGYVESRSLKSCSLKHLSKSKAQDLYLRAQYRLMNVNAWAKVIGIEGQTFRLFNHKGQLAKRGAREGDLVEITLPLDPTFRTYWVRIETLETRYVAKGTDALHLIVRPTRNPFLPKKKGVTDHFFENTATNSFIITRTPTTLTSEVHGLHEKANTTQTRGWSDAAENIAISEMGWGIQKDGKAELGFQKLVWNNLNSKLADCE